MRILKKRKVVAAQNSKANIANKLIKLVEPPAHPLLIDVVMDIVFTKLPEGDLRLCRLVCKTWEVISSTHLKRRLHKEDNRYCIMRNEKSFIEFNKLFLTGNTTNFYSHFSLGNQIAFGSNSFLKFFNSFSENIRGLKIRFPISFSQIVSLLKFQGEFLTKLSVNCRDLKMPWNLIKTEISLDSRPFLPCLKSLEVHAREHINERVLRVILNQSPLLESYTFEMNSSKFWGIFNLFGQEHWDNLVELRLRKFKCNIEDYEAFVDLSQERRIRLKVFEIKLDDDDERNIFSQFLDSQKNTLEYLKISNAGRVRIPPMPRLKTLKIFEPDCEELTDLEVILDDENEEDQRRETFLPFNFEKNFPSLKELDCAPFEHEDDQQIDNFNSKIYPADQKPSSLEKLTLYDGFLSPSILRRVADIFPHLKILHIREYSECSDEAKTKTLKALWKIQAWQNSLEELHIDFGIEKIHLDSVFSGVSKANLEEIYKKKNVSRNTPISLPKGFAKAKSNSMLRLKNLRSLKIHYCEQQYYSYNYFTDVTGLYIFAKMLKLDELLISKFAHKFSKLCSGEIKKQAPHFNPNWIFKDEEYYPIEDDGESDSSSSGSSDEE